MDLAYSFMYDAVFFDALAMRYNVFDYKKRIPELEMDSGFFSGTYGNRYCSLLFCCKHCSFIGIGINQKLFSQYALY
jgi:hypothetical protein